MDHHTDHTLDTALATPDDLGFSGTRAAKVVGITYRQLDYWARTDLIRPSLNDAAGSGSRRRYSYNDLLELKAIKKLLDAGIKLEQVRKVFDYLREHVSTDIAAAHIVIDGSSVNLYDDGQLIDVLQRGQGVLNVLSMGGVKSELEADLAPSPTDLDDTVRKIGWPCASHRWRHTTRHSTPSSSTSAVGRCRSPTPRAPLRNTLPVGRTPRCSTCHISARSASRAMTPSSGSSAR